MKLSEFVNEERNSEFDRQEEKLYKHLNKEISKKKSQTINLKWHFLTSFGNTTGLTKKDLEKILFNVKKRMMGEGHGWFKYSLSIFDDIAKIEVK